MFTSRPLRAAAIAVISLPLLTGCGGNAEKLPETPATKQAQAASEEQKTAASEKKEAPAADGINTFTPRIFEVHSPEGARIMMDIPSAGDYPELKALLKELHAGNDFSFILADVDNRQGTTQISINRIEITDLAGKTYTYKALYDYLIDFDIVHLTDLNTQPSRESYRLHDGTEIDHNEAVRLSDAINAQRHSELAKLVIPQGQGKMLLVGPKLPELVTSVQVYPSSVADGIYAAPKQP
ncbi:hypothetical protein ACUH91_00575 [Dermabacteraceae bacterium P9123]